MPDISQIVTRYNAVKSDHDGYWLTTWREVREYVHPSKVDYLIAGARSGDKVFDPTAVDANIRLAAGLYAWLCPPDKRWFELQTQNEQLRRIDSVKWWFAEVNRIIYDALSNSNWPLMFHESALNLGSSGTGVLYVEEGDKSLLNFLSLNIEKVCVLEDKEQRVDTVFREFEYTARQCVQEFGKDKCTDAMKAAYESDAQKEKKFRVLHAVMPREDAKGAFPGSKLDSEEMPNASMWIDLQTKSLLLESGYWENPYIVFRFSKNDDEVYGRSPGMSNIQEIKMLNRYRRSDILGTEKIVDPPVLLPDNCLVDSTFRTNPGATNYIRAVAGGMLPQSFFDGAHMPQLDKKLEESRTMIRLGFFNDMFDSLGDNKNMTVPEVMERIESKLVPFAPVVGRLQSELFSPVIVRCFGILFRMGAFPKIPPELIQNPSYKIEYVSRISMAIKQLEAKGLMQTLDMITPLAAQKPELFDHFDDDAIVRGLSKNNGVPSEWIRPDEKVQAIRAARAKAIQAQQTAAQAAELAKAVPAAGKAPERGSPLKALMGVAA